jgi:hypothetical protein
MWEFLKVGYVVLGLVFQAGVTWAVFTRMRKDLNGMGSKMRGLDERESDRYLAVTIAILIVASDKDRQFLAGRLLDAGRRK